MIFLEKLCYRTTFLKGFHKIFTEPHALDIQLKELVENRVILKVKLELPPCRKHSIIQ